MNLKINKFYKKSMEITEILKQESLFYFVFVYSLVIFQLILALLFLFQNLIYFQISFITYTVLFIPATVIFGLALDRFNFVRHKVKKSLKNIFSFYYIIFWISFLCWIVPFLIFFNFNLATVYFI